MRVKGARAVGFTEISRTLKTPDYCAGATTIKDLKNVQIAKHTKRARAVGRKAQAVKVMLGYRARGQKSIKQRLKVGYVWLFFGGARSCINLKRKTFLAAQVIQSATYLLWRKQNKAQNFLTGAKIQRRKVFLERKHLKNKCAQNFSRRKADSNGKNFG